MSRVKELLFAHRLPDATETEFEELIQRSLVDAYFGPNMPLVGPVDAGHARNLLFQMWSGLAHEDALWSALAHFLERYEGDDDVQSRELDMG
jgi:hypothetical protein